MEFLNLGLLLGAVAAAVPVIIHLIQRKRAPEHVFPPARFLQEDRQNISRRFHLRHILVMLLRALFIMLLALAFARPFIERTPAVTLTEEPTLCIVVVDDTLSMRHQMDGADDTIFGRAVRRGRKMMRGMRDFDETAVVTFSGRAAGPTSPSGDHHVRADALDQLRPTYGNDGASGALQRAQHILGSSHLDEKKMIVLSDMTRSSWSRGDFELLNVDGVDVSMPRLINKTEAFSNRFFRRVDVSSTRDGIGVRADIEVMGDWQNDPATVEMFLRGELRDRRRVEFHDRSLRLGAEVSGREYTGRLELPEDKLPADDSFYFAGRTESSLNVLLVEGDPHETLYHNETYHVDLALSSRTADINTKVVTHDRLNREDLEEYDCIMLANVRAGEYPSRERIESYLRDGGAMWVVLGDHAHELRDGHTAFRELLPVTLREIRDAEADGGERILAQRLAQPIVKPFSPRWVQQFGDTQFRSWWVMTPREEAEVLMELGNGHPLLVKKDVGGGEILVMGSPLDRDWNDFCLQPVFVPFMQQTVRFLSDNLASVDKNRLWVGQTYRMEMPGDVDSLHIQAPGQQSWKRFEMMKRDTKSVLHYELTERPGIYSVARDEKGENLIARFTVNPRPEASDLRRWPQKEMRTRRQTEMGEADRNQAAVSSGVGIWNVLLWCGLLTLVAESCLARK
ncbi:MAG: BatA domain-containing protein [Planctomycetota bacterium]